MKDLRPSIGNEINWSQPRVNLEALPKEYDVRSPTFWHCAKLMLILLIRPANNRFYWDN